MEEDVPLVGIKDLCKTKSTLPANMGGDPCLPTYEIERNTSNMQEVTWYNRLQKVKK
jgi:hypothetical protein